MGFRSKCKDALAFLERVPNPQNYKLPETNILDAESCAPQYYEIPVLKCVWLLFIYSFVDLSIFFHCKMILTIFSLFFVFTNFFSDGEEKKGNDEASVSYVEPPTFIPTHLAFLQSLSVKRPYPDTVDRFTTTVYCRDCKILYYGEDKYEEHFKNGSPCSEFPRSTPVFIEVIILSYFCHRP